MYLEAHWKTRFQYRVWQSGIETGVRLIIGRSACARRKGLLKMSFTPSPEDEEPRSGFTLRMEFDRREDRCFYCHNCNAPFSIGHLTTVSLNVSVLCTTYFASFIPVVWVCVLKRCGYLYVISSHVVWVTVCSWNSISWLCSHDEFHYLTMVP